MILIQTPGSLFTTRKAIRATALRAHYRHDRGWHTLAANDRDEFSAYWDRFADAVRVSLLGDD